MVRLVYSNRTEALLVELAARVRSQQLRDGPLLPVCIVVPSPSVEAYVRMGIAREAGIAANLDVMLLRRFASEIVGAPSVRVADALAIQAMALELLLDDEALAASGLEPVRAYLVAAGAAPDAIDTRRVQLASELGRLFEEYTYSRGDMLFAWRTGVSLAAHETEAEGWQRHLWLAMFGEGGLTQRRASITGERLVALHEAVRAFDPVGLNSGVDRSHGGASVDALREGRARWSRAVHVFAFAHVARTFHELFERLGRETDVVVYALSPCEGFWEDLDPLDPEPLQLWGRPGREQVRVLNAAAGFDHDDRFVDPLDAGEPRTLLRQLQSDVMRRERRVRDREPVVIGGDGSIVLTEHASIRRELEAVASEIWRIGEREDVSFDDFAVLVPDAQSADYAALLPNVFREAYGIPHQMVGLGPGTPGGVLEAVHLVLALPLSRFTRQDVLRVVVHPAVLGSLDDVDKERWVAWCEALGIVHGADRTDHEGTYIPRDILNWDQGLRRLALGALMTGDATGERRPFDLGSEAYVPHEVAPSDLRDTAGFGLLVRSLLADARFARREKLTLSDWASFLQALVEAYVTPGSRAEEEDLSGCLRAIHQLGTVDVGPTRVRYRLACELARARLPKASLGQGAEGVVVSTLAALRPIPFRNVFACGLGEGLFPSPEADDPLDLRWARRQQGDLSARDRDRHAFLELLLGTRDRLLLSYVSRDAVTGDALAPSSLVQELLYVLGQGYVGEPSRLRVRHPLRRWDARYFPDLFPSGENSAPLGTMRLVEARAEARSLALRLHADQSGARVDLDTVADRASNDPAWAALADHLGLLRLAPAVAKRDARIVIPLYAIVKFLEFPLQGWARFRLGLDEREDDDVMAREDEPFETDFRDETMLLRSVLLEAAAGGVSLTQAYDAEVERRAIRGDGPSGLFSRSERVGHLAVLEMWRAELAGFDVATDSVEVHRFGRDGELARADHVHDAVALDVDVADAAGVVHLARVEVGGRTSAMSAGGYASLTLLKRPKPEKTDDWGKAEHDRLTLRAFVDHVVLSASGVGAGRAHDAIVVLSTPDKPDSKRTSFAPLARDRAAAWLRSVVRDLLTGPHAYFFPCESALAWQRSAARGDLVDWIAKARNFLGDSDNRSALRSAYGPVPRSSSYPIPGEDAARDFAMRRLGLLFELRHDTESRKEGA